MAELTIYSKLNHDVVYRLSSTYPYDPNEYPIIWGAASADYATDSNLPIGQAEIDYAGAPADPPRFVVWRGFFWFDTSSIPVDATINSVKLYIKHRIDTVYYDNTYSLIVQKGISVDENNIPVVHHNPYDYTDYNKNNVSGNGGSIAASTIGASGEYFFITLNGVGIGWINKGVGAISKLCVRTNEDIDGTEPEWRVNKYLQIYMSDTGVADSNRPYLFIDYTPAPAEPVVTTQAATQIDYDCAMGNGTIVSGTDITERGFEVKVYVDFFGVGPQIFWNLIGFVDEGEIVYHSFGQRTGYLIKRETWTGTFEVGVYEGVLGKEGFGGSPMGFFNDALEVCESYTYRAYATNDVGTGYGDWIAFNTPCYPKGHLADDQIPIEDFIPPLPPFEFPPFEFPPFEFPPFEFPEFDYPEMPSYDGSWLGAFYYRKAYTKKDLDELRKKCRIFLDNSVEFALVLNHNMQVLKQFLNMMHDYLDADEYNTFKFLIPTQWLNELAHKPLDIKDFKVIINNFISNSISNASNVNHNFVLIENGLNAYMSSEDVNVGIVPIEVRTKMSRDDNPDVERLKKVVDALSVEMANNYTEINHNLRVVRATLI